MDHVPPFSPARRCTFQQKYLQTPTRTRRLQIVSFVVVTCFWCFSYKDSHDLPLKRNVFSLFLQKLLLLHKEFHTLWKLNHYCIDKVAAEISFSAKDSLQKRTTGDKKEIALVSLCHLFFFLSCLRTGRPSMPYHKLN